MGLSTRQQKPQYLPTWEWLSRAEELFPVLKGFAVPRFCSCPHSAEWLTDYPQFSQKRKEERGMGRKLLPLMDLT